MELDGNTVVTVGLAVFVGVCVIGAIGVVMWLYARFDALKTAGADGVELAKKELLEAIAASRVQSDDRLEEVGSKVDGLVARQTQHELNVEREFVRKDSAAASYGRLETALAEVRGDIKNLTAVVTSTIRNVGRRRTGAGDT